MPPRSFKRRRVVVIGSGPVGAAAARRLAERGCATTLLDAGAPVPLPDLPSARPGEHPRNRPLFQRDPDAFIVDAIGRCTFYDAAAPPQGLPGACETIAFGGQSLVWTNNCPRTQAGIDRWPVLNDAEWERYYTDAEALLSVGVDQFGTSERQRRIETRLAAHLAPAGRRVAPLPLAARPRPGGGVHFTATADVLGDLAEGSAYLSVRWGVQATQLEHRGARVTAVRVATSSGEERLDADAVVVAAGPFATPRLLYVSGIRPRALGRWLHYHPLLLGQVVLEEELSASPGPVDPPPRLWVPPARATPWHGMLLRDVGAGAPMEAVDERRLIELQFFAPIVPRETHQMTLDGARPQFAVALTPDDRATMDAMHADVLAIGKALGRWRQGCEPQWNPPGFSHPMGTTRMGDDPASSVVDRRGRVHGLDNLYLAGVGVVPVPIAINPTLTAVALALATVDRLAV